VFTARYALSPYIKQMCFVFKGLITQHKSHTNRVTKEHSGELFLHRTLLLKVNGGDGYGLPKY
jgi:hypothetical protein